MTADRIACICALAVLLWTVGTAEAQSGPSPAASAPPTASARSEDAPQLPAGFDKALERVLDRKLAPISRALAEMQEQKVRPTDVLGGLGYILGLVGVAAYVKARRGGSGR
jgi:nickel transport protein